MQLIVMGMHRSGTSAVTRLLNMAGAYFGPEGVATDTNAENPKGFWERRDVRAVCDGLLHAGGFDWWKVADFAPDRIPIEAAEPHLAAFDEFLAGIDANRPWVVKEPRLCLLLPLLQSRLEAPLFVHVTREPVEVVASVARRNDFPEPVGAALWERYTLASLRATAGHPRIHVRHEDLMADPLATLARLVEWAETEGAQGLRLPVDREVTAFVDPALHREHADAAERGQLLNARQAALAAAIDDERQFDDEWATAEPSSGGVAALRAFEEARRRIDELEELRASSAAEAETARAEANEIERIREETVERLQETAAAVSRESADQVKVVEDGLRNLSTSPIWKIAELALVLRSRITQGRERQRRGRLRVAADRLDDVRQGLTALQVDVDPARMSLAGSVTVRAHGPEPVPDPDRLRVAVLGWDLGHNPFGRSYVMAEMLARHCSVEVWGAHFDRYGSELWAPLRHPELPVHTFTGGPLPEYLHTMEEVAAAIEADVVWVSKPRFPSFALGILAKRLRNRLLVVDVDDHELAFFDADDGLALDQLAALPRQDLTLPFEEAWTRACDPLVREADLVTVSSVALQRRYGGEIVGHARDEQRFDPARVDRDGLRRRLGVAPTDRLILFGGTARVHKGVIEILEALDQLDDPRYRLAVFDTRELGELRGRISDFERWIIRIPLRPFHELEQVVVAADLSCALQDLDHPVARYQMPAKISDALAMRVPCLVAELPSVRPLIDADVVHVRRTDQPLHEAIAEVFADPDATAERADRGRDYFLRKLSYEVVGSRVAELFAERATDPPPLSPALVDLVDRPRRLLDADGGSGPSPRATAMAAPEVVPGRLPGSRRWRAVPGETYDLVVFWKQNDTGIYGRRQDMLLEYLRRTGRFEQIVHFDEPVTPEQLVKLYRGSSGSTDQSRLVVRQTVERLLHRRDGGGVVHRTFVHRGARSGLLGLPDRGGYVDYVRKQLARNEIGKRLTVFLVYPTNPHFPALADALEPDFVIADVVDDNRTWYEPGSEHHDRVEANYREVLARADVVLANCEPVADALGQFAPEVHVVANGCEIVRGPRPPRPVDLAGIPGPVIGYVGNLSDRIDLDLLDELAVKRPDWSFVFIGTAHRDRSALRLDRHKNVHFLGVRPYDEARTFIRHFDVALIPHVVNDMTNAMNPLKAFVYCAAGVPVVATPVAGLDGLGELITVAKGVDGFVGAIEDALAADHREPDLDILGPHTWERRAASVVELLDRAAGLEPD